MFNMTITALITKLKTAVFNPIIRLLFAAGFVLFLWGAAQYIFNADNDQARRTGSQHMIWGIIGMAIMAFAASILAVLRNTLGF